MSEDKEEKAKNGDEEQRLRERLKARQESRRKTSSPAPSTPRDKEASVGGSSIAKDSLTSPQKELTTQQKRRGRRRRRERRRQNREANRNRYYNSYDNDYPPYNHYNNGGHYNGRWERHGPPPRGGYPPVRGGWGEPQRGGGRYDIDPYGRRRRYHSRSRSRSRSRSLSPSGSRSSRSYSRSSRSSSRSVSRSRSSRSRRSASRSHSRKRSRQYSSDSSISDHSSSASSSSSESEVAADKKEAEDVASTFTKDQRTVFVTQLVMRTTEKDLRKYFRKKVGCKVNEVILLRDKRTGRHKGYAYVELRQIEDVTKALQVSGQPPDFQRFPIMIKPSEAEKNYIIPASSSTLTARMMGAATTTGPIMGANGKLMEAQKVYVGSLDPSVTQERLFALFSQFGQLEKVNMQMDPATGMSRGFAFLSFRDPKEANLAIQTMSNQVLSGRPMKTGWANQASSIPGVEIVTSDEFPEDASIRAQKAHMVLAQLAAGITPTPGMNMTEGHLDTLLPGSPVATRSAVPTVAAARASLTGVSQQMVMPGLNGMPAAPNGVPAGLNGVSQMTSLTGLGSPKATLLDRRSNATADPKAIAAQNPTKCLLIHNMFDKDEETEEGWEEDIRQDFQEECSKYGKLTTVTIMSKEPGGKIYAAFETTEGAKTCASSLAGRWFDKRQLLVEYVQENEIPSKQ